MKSASFETLLFLSLGLVFFLVAFAGMGQIAKSTDIIQLKKGVPTVCGTLCMRKHAPLYKRKQ